MDELVGVDWRKQWVMHNQARKAPDDAAYWDGRAEEFSRWAGSSSYSDTFLAYLYDYLATAPLPPVSPRTILDIGCGCGTLALPLARAGHQVLAVDFSLGMIDVLQRLATESGLQNIGTAVLDTNAAWADWQAAGITEKSADVAVASRSMMVDDLWGAMQKLERVARERVAITMATEYGPRETKHIGEPVNGRPFVPDYIFAVNLLFQMGRYPELRYIDSLKTSEHGDSMLVRWAFITWAV